MANETIDDHRSAMLPRDRRGDRAHLGAPARRDRGGRGAGPPVDAARARSRERRHGPRACGRGRRHRLRGGRDHRWERPPDHQRLLAGDARRRPPPRRRARPRERRLPGDQRRAHRARRRLGRRRALPVRLHADGRSRGGVRRDTPSAAPGRPGGAGGLGSVERNPWIAIAGISLASAATSRLLPPPAPGPFSMANAERTTALLDDAGFTEVRTEEVPVRFGCGPRRVPGPDRRHRRPDRADAAGARGAERAAVKADVEDSLERFAATDGYELPCVALCARRALSAVVSESKPTWGPASTAARLESLPTVLVDGTALAYREHGDGEPVVFVHGSASDLRSWGQQAARGRHRPTARSRIAAVSHDPIGTSSRARTTRWLPHVDDLAAFAPASPGRRARPPRRSLVGRLHLPGGPRFAIQSWCAACCSRSRRSCRCTSALHRARGSCSCCSPGGRGPR